jgi:long-chain acyl-CoA synthetase
MNAYPPADANTFPRLLAHHARVRGAKPAMREKDLGIWQTWNWSQVADEVRAIACGLAAEGVKRGDRVAVIGANRPFVYWSICAVQCLGAIPVGLYQDAIADELLYIFQNAEIRHAIVEDQEQVDKVLEIREKATLVGRIYYDDPRGLRNYSQPELMAFEKLKERGREHDRAHPGFYDAEVAAGRPEDAAAMFTTSGTTGHPKGVVHTYASLIDRARVGCELDRLTDAEEILAYLPPAWIGQNIFSYAQSLYAGFCVNCPEAAGTVTVDMREIGPTYYFAPPRVYENLLTAVTIRMEDASSLKRALFKRYMAVAERVGTRLIDGKPVGLFERLDYALGDILVYGPLRNALGMSRVRVAYTAGEAIGPDLFRFYRSLGINLKQLYGSTETAVFVCVQPDGQVSAETVGPPVQGVELKVAENGELMIKSPGLLKEYFKNPAATAEVLTNDGWYHSGDAGFIDHDGHLRIIDRAKDVGKLANGAMFAPKYIENKLKFFPFIKEAVALGDRRDMVTAMINIEMEAVGNWAERRGLVYGGYVDLASQAAVYDLIRECVEKVNADLAQEERLADSQIRRFLILHKELDADDGELTRTSKVRRGFIAEKYGVLVEALYGGKPEQYVETAVKFEDGRTGKVSATLRIMDVKTFPVARQAA